VAKVTAGHSHSASPSPSASPSASPAGNSSGSPATAISSQGDPVWDHTAGTWLTDMGILILLALAYAIITWWRLVRMGPVKRR
jgi:hypothetical protein